MPRLIHATCEPADRNHSRFVAQLNFLQAIEETAPKVLDDLSEKPLKAVLESKPMSMPPIGDNKAPVFVHRIGTPESEKIDQLISGCLSEHRILTDWMVTFARDTIYIWANHPEKKWPECRNSGTCAWWYQTKQAQKALDKNERLFRFVHDFDDPCLFPYQDRKKREEIEKAVRARFEQLLKAHLDKLSRIPNGFVNPKAMRDQRQFDWIVHVRVNRLSEEDIHERFAPEVELTSIKAEIRRGEKFLGLPSLKRRGGSRPGPRKRLKRGR